MPADIEYLVSEDDANRNGYRTTSTGEQGIIPAGDTAEAIFENYRKTVTPLDEPDDEQPDIPPGVLPDDEPQPPTPPEPEEGNNVPTGDNANLIGYLVLIGVCSAGLIAVLLWYLRGRKTRGA